MTREHDRSSLHEPSSLRVLQVQSASRTPGGADAVMDLEAELLAAAGHRVERYTYPAVAEQAGLRTAAEVVWNPQAAHEVGRATKAFGADIVHVHSPYPRLSPAVFAAATRAGAATVTTMHNYRFACPVATLTYRDRPCEACVGKRVKLPAVRRSCYHDSAAKSAAMTASLALHSTVGSFTRHLHRSLVFTEFAREIFVREGLPAERVGVQPNTVADPGEPAKRSGGFGGALFVGRLVPEKGVLTLLEAAAGLPDVPVAIAGDGPLRPQVEAAAARHPWIRYHGWQDEAGLAPLFAAADLLVVPSSWYEGQPLVMLQAMAAGLPLVTTDLANLVETAGIPQTGRTFALGDPLDLRAQLRSASQDISGLRVMGGAARQRYLARHTPAQASAGLTGHYRAALAAAAISGGKHA
mgnify:CR=1 FL=1